MKEFILYYDPNYPYVDFDIPSEDDYIDGGVNEVKVKKQWHFDDWYSFGENNIDYYICQENKIYKFERVSVRFFPLYNFVY